MPQTHSTIQQLIEQLADPDGMRRQQARHALVARRSAAVPALLEALQGDDRTRRWEAAKALASCADDSAVGALMRALDDDDDAVRWLAAAALVRLDRVGIEAALKALIAHPESSNVRLGAHHVLHSAGRHGWEAICDPVVAALEGLDASVTAPVVADRALTALRRTS